MPAKKEPKLWLTILKLVIGAVALVSLVWFSLSFLSGYTDDAPGAPTTKSKMDWGIANDSPIPSRR
ncbi:hypothetical protein os4_10410 [Comamonadaceae bacterium OS-4]|nr:hypothetical protein os4_10410 [Comamonadaceae bacterium OS-4]